MKKKKLVELRTTELKNKLFLKETMLKFHKIEDEYQMELMLEIERIKDVLKRRGEI